MNNTQQLRRIGQSVWLDNVTRDLLTSGTLARYIDELGVTGLTSNPAIYNKAIGGSAAYDEPIERLNAAGASCEETFFELAIDDLGRAADMFKPVHKATNGVDGFVSLEVSPLLANDARTTLSEARRLHARAGRPNLFIKIPGTTAGLWAIEEAIFAGVPINVTLLFSDKQYLAAADAYTRGVERRVAAGLDPYVPSVASVFVSRWDAYAPDDLPADLHMQIGPVTARQTFEAYRDLIDSERWQILLNEGARPQRLLWASTGTKDPKASDVYYVEALAAPFTVNTMPEETLLAFADHGSVSHTLRPDHDPADDEILARIARAGIDLDEFAGRLQVAGVDAFDKAWQSLIGIIEKKAAAVAQHG